MKVGYIHYDGGSGTNLPFKKALKIEKFNPDYMREGGPNATLHIFGATSIPLDVNFDYGQVDCDIVYFWLQGGVGPELNALKKFRKSTDATFVLFFDDVYWIDPSSRAYYLELWRPITDNMDVLSSGYLNDGERVKQLDKPWKYLPYPHDIPYYKQFFNKEKNDAFFSMIHGRMTSFNRTMFAFKALRELLPYRRFIIHPYRFFTKEQVLKQYNFDWIEFTPVVDDWFKLLGEQRVQIDEYPCLSQSQVVTQAACVGTPTISHPYNAPNAVCFPKLTFPLHDVRMWVAGATTLETPCIYEEIQKYAFEAVEEYNFDKFHERLTNIYEEFKK